MNRKLIAVPVIALAAGLSLAACGSAKSHTAPPTVTHTVTAPAATPSSAPAAAALTGDQKACRAIEAHALPHTQQQVNDYMSFLSRESLVASNPVLQTAIMNVNAGILGVMAGTLTEAQENARGAKVDALCAKT